MKKKWPSGRRRQTVNLLVNTHVGSNPTFFTIFLNGNIPTRTFTSSKETKKKKIISRTSKRRVRFFKKMYYTSLNSPIDHPISLGLQLNLVGPLLIAPNVPLPLKTWIRWWVKSLNLRRKILYLKKIRKNFTKKRFKRRYFLLRLSTLTAIGKHKSKYKKLNKIRNSLSRGLIDLSTLPSILNYKIHQTLRDGVTLPVCNSFSKFFIVEHVSAEYETCLEENLFDFFEHAYIYYKYLNRRSNVAITTLNYYPQLSVGIFSNWLKSWSRFLGVYVGYCYVPKIELYLKLKKLQKKEVKHNVRFCFKSRRFFLNFGAMVGNLNYFSLSPGFFLRFFQFKKSIKKKKITRVLMVRFLRKVLLVLKLKSVGLVIKGVPTQMNLLLHTLFKRLSQPFVNPLTETIFNDSYLSSPALKDLGLSSIFFTKSKYHNAQKLPKKGRLKRKITRKLVRISNAID